MDRFNAEIPEKLADFVSLVYNSIYLALVVGKQNFENISNCLRNFYKYYLALIIIIVSFFGCFGAATKSGNMLNIYALLVIILLIGFSV